MFNFGRKSRHEATQADTLRRLYHMWHLWRNKLDWAEGPAEVDEAILGMRWCEYRMRSERRELGLPVHPKKGDPL